MSVLSCLGFIRIMCRRITCAKCKFGLEYSRFGWHVHQTLKFMCSWNGFSHLFGHLLHFKSISMIHITWMRHYLTDIDMFQIVIDASVNLYRLFLHVCNLSVLCIAKPCSYFRWQTQLCWLWYACWKSWSFRQCASWPKMPMPSW